MAKCITPSLFETSLRRVSGIYLIQHIASKKAYVGGTHDLGQRRSDHFTSLENGCHKNRHLQRAFHKYRRKAFRFVVLEECPVERLAEREQYWIDFYRAADRRYGYNINPQAGHSIVTEETRRRIGETSRGRAPSRETRQKIAKKNLGKKRTVETRQKLRDAALRRWASVGEREAQSQRFKGRIISDTTRQKMSQRAKRRARRPHSEETKQRMREAWKRRKERNE